MRLTPQRCQSPATLSGEDEARTAILRRLEEIAGVAARMRPPPIVEAEPAPVELELACERARQETTLALEARFAAEIAAREDALKAEAAALLDDILQSYRASIARQDQILRDVVAEACGHLLDAALAARAVATIPVSGERGQPLRITAGAGYAGTMLLQQLGGRLAPDRVNIETTTALDARQVMLSWEPGWAEIDGAGWLSTLKERLSAAPVADSTSFPDDGHDIHQRERTANHDEP